MIVSSESPLVWIDVDEVALFLAQLRRREHRRHADDAVHGRADFVAHVGEELGLRARGLLQPLVEREQRRVAVHELLLAGAQGAVGLVALDLADVGAGVVADARDEFDLVRQLDEVIVRSRPRTPVPLTAGSSLVESTMIGV